VRRRRGLLAFGDGLRERIRGRWRAGVRAGLERGDRLREVIV
jgi:hypothetical protein